MRMEKRIGYVAAVCFITSCLANTVSFASDADSIKNNTTYAIATTGATAAPTATPAISSGKKAATPSATPSTVSSAVPNATPTATANISLTAAPTPTPEITPSSSPGTTPGTASTQAPSGTPDKTPAISPSPDALAAPAASPAATPEIVPTPTPSDDESLWYREKLPLKKEHQKLLWNYCKTRKLDYIDMLALISTESNFNEKASSGKHKGYFQISTSHGANLSKTLKTLNKPLDGAININWGTAMYSWILDDKRVKEIKDEKEKRDAALSIYQRGTGGYDKYGLSTGFLKIFYKKRSIVGAYFEDKTEKK